MIIQSMHPLEVIRTRLQSHDGHAKTKNNLVPDYKNSIRATRMIYQQEGMRGLYKGGVLSLFGNCGSQFLFFFLYNNLLQQEQSVAWSSGLAGAMVVLITQPVWTVKTRLLLTTEYIPWQSMVASREIMTQHGTKGFYRGLVVSLVLSSSTIIQLNIYESLQSLIHRNTSSSPTDYWSFLNGGFSKMASTVATYPLITLRTRIQQNQYVSVDSQQQKYSNYLDIYWKTIRQEGPGGFYKGLAPSLVKSTPQSALFFFFYEYFKNNVDYCHLY